jgi:hypothetical protein
VALTTLSSSNRTYGFHLALSHCRRWIYCIFILLVDSVHCSLKIRCLSPSPNVCTLFDPFLSKPASIHARERLVFSAADTGGLIYSCLQIWFRLRGAIIIQFPLHLCGTTILPPLITMALLAAGSSIDITSIVLS